MQDTDKQAELEKRLQYTKQRALQLAESMGWDKPDTEEQQQKKKDEKKSDGFFARLGMKVVDNIQIFINDIHIRYEDDVSNPDHPFVLGITLDSLFAQSTNENWEPTFLTVGSDIMHKVRSVILSPLTMC